jgi:hypothetical protein
MAKKTLLEMTQQILDAMDSDSVNSIDDTVEASQVASIVREAYEDLATQRDWSWLKELTTLTALADTDQPTTFEIPEGVNKILWLKYNGEDVTYMEPKEFKDLLDSRAEVEDEVDENGIVLTRDPLYWTSYDDQNVVMDAYNAEDESTLQQSNLDAYCVMVPSWTHEDGFTPQLPEKMFPTLIADAKGTAFLQLKQQANAKEETKARRGKARFQNEAKRVKAAEHVTNGGVNFGRK